MLEKIHIKNICSIGEAEMDFTKGNYQYLKDNILNNVVNPIVIYGRNGSGKTSFFRAIAQFINMMIAPLENLSPFEVNFLNIKESEPNLESSFDLKFTIKNTSYFYSITTSLTHGITKEFLKKDDNLIFKRNSEKYVFNDKEFDLSNKSSLVLVLRTLASNEIDDDVIQSVYKFLSSFICMDLLLINKTGFITSKLSSETNIYDLLVERSNEVKEILKEFDNFPVYSIKEKENVLQYGNPFDKYTVVLEDRDKFKLEIPFDMISIGMKNVSIILTLLCHVPKDTVIFIDELDTDLHLSTIKCLLEVAKKKKIQLVFSSHNTNILTYLRPDQVYFSKWKKGYSKLLRLSSIYPNIREVNNIEKMYLSHIFDDIISEK